MCLSKTPYKLYLHSADGTQRGPSGTSFDSIAHKQFAFNWNSLLQDNPDVKYFHCKVESFCFYLPLGGEVPQFEIHIDQIESPYYYSSNQGKPLAVVSSGQIIDVNLDPSTESLKAVSYKLDASQTMEQVVCIRKEPILDVRLKSMIKDPNVGVSELIPYGKTINSFERFGTPNFPTYKDSLNNDRPYPDYILVLSLTPIKE